MRQVLTWVNVIFFRGFGLHAGKAVQGAIGSQRKLDATYLSEAVERAEFLESSTKIYGKNGIWFECCVWIVFHISSSFLFLFTHYRCPVVDE